jgi:nucleoid DNA-binding protein
VLESFLDRLHVHLEEGRIVKLGDLGNFSPAISSIGTDALGDVSKSSIKKLRVNFRPSVELKDRLSRVKFEKQYEAPEPAE